MAALDKLEQHACGIFACVLADEVSLEDQSDVAKTIYLGLVGLQHRWVRILAFFLKILVYLKTSIKFARK